MTKFTYALLALALVLVTGSAGAQTQEPEGWDFSSVSVSAGEDALSSGITGGLWMNNAKKKTTFNFVVQHEQGWFLYGRRFHIGKAGGVIAGSVGHMMGEPWIGPYFDMKAPVGTVLGQKVSASVIVWPCVFGREPERWRNDGKPKNTETLKLGVLWGYQVNIGRVGLVYSWLDFLDDPLNKLPGVSYTQNIRKDFSVTGSVTRNVNAKKWMYFVGATWNP